MLAEVEGRNRHPESEQQNRDPADHPLRIVRRVFVCLNQHTRRLGVPRGKRRDGPVQSGSDRLVHGAVVLLQYPLVRDYESIITVPTISAYSDGKSVTPSHCDSLAR